ncbi:flavin-containing monooxygenase [Dactylosporangium sp. NPDC048998]|uniref:flavin-containing monooxygenase n=1 Tax=Dactylosporangium sp. NPDC048998 TaxID=3363976 RepID=UPI00372051D2
MALNQTDQDTDADEVYAAWLRRFGDALERHDIDAVLGDFAAESYWKDVLAFTWGYRTFGERSDIEAGLRATIAATRPRNVRKAQGRTPARLVRRSAKDVIEAYFDFDTAVGSGTGFVRLLYAPGSATPPTIWILLTTLQELRGFEPRTGDRRPSGLQYSHNFAGDNWTDERRRAVETAGERAEVLVVGAGQAGLALAARLGQLGVQTLLVEKNPRVGDNWRDRYHSLTLHNEVWSNHLPYLPFPDTWPAFVPKDKLADWLEYYAEAMELNVWTSTEAQSARFDRDTERWTVRLRRADGSVRDLTVPHLVLATGGTSGVPNIPELPGLADYEGTVLHSGKFTSGVPYAGKRALVVGTGTSGHDVAQDLRSNGAEVTLMQRSPTCVVSLIPCGTMVYAVYSEGPPADDVDLVTAAIPFPVLQSTYRFLTRKTTELDQALLDGLAARGFKLDFGTDATGFHMMYLRKGGGYYINVGASDLIVSGEIELIQAGEYETFVPAGIRLKTGRMREYDLVVLATGYRDQQDGIRAMLGDEVADKVGPVWGFDDNYIMRNMWQRTAQEGLWVAGGSLLDCRLYSRFLALLIKADLEGISSTEVALPSTRYDTTGRSTILESV